MISSFKKSCIIIIFKIYLWLGWVFIAVCGLSLVAASRGSSSWLCAGFSLPWLLLLQSTGSGCSGFSSRDARAWLPYSTWNLPGPGIKPVSPALAGRFLTTGLLGKSTVIGQSVHPLVSPLKSILCTQWVLHALPPHGEIYREGGCGVSLSPWCHGAGRCRGAEAAPSGQRGHSSSSSHDLKSPHDPNPVHVFILSSHCSPASCLILEQQRDTVSTRRFCSAGPASCAL